jgi:hypothetical protein
MALNTPKYLIPPSAEDRNPAKVLRFVRENGVMVKQYANEFRSEYEFVSDGRYYGPRIHRKSRDTIPIWGNGRTQYPIRAK